MRGSEVTDIRSAPVYFSVLGQLAYFKSDIFGMMISALRDMGLYYNDRLFVPADLISRAFGYGMIVEKEDFSKAETVRAVIVFNERDGAKGVEMDPSRFNVVLDKVFSSQTYPIQEVFWRAPEDFDCYINFYNADGSKWTIWFSDGWPFFLDAAYGNGRYMWRFNGTYSGETIETIRGIIQAYRPYAQQTGELYTSAKEALYLPKDKEAADIISRAADRSLFRFGYMNDDIHASVLRKDLHEMIVFTLFSANFRNSADIVGSWLNSLIFSDNGKLYGFTDEDDSGFSRYVGYTHYGLAAYLHAALGYADKSVVLNPNEPVTREEAVLSIEAVMTLFTGSKEHRATVWQWVGGVPDNPLSKLDANSVMLELFEFFLD